MTLEGFYRASTHERTTDIEKMNPLMEKTNINVPVEEELNEFRQEIEQKYAESETKSYVMQRTLKFKSPEVERECSTERKVAVPLDKATPTTVKSRVTHHTHSHSSVMHQKSSSFDRIVHHKKQQSAVNIEDSPVSITRQYLSQDYDSPGEPEDYCEQDNVECATSPMAKSSESKKYSKSSKIANPLW